MPFFPGLTPRRDTAPRAKNEFPEAESHRLRAATDDPPVVSNAPLTDAEDTALPPLDLATQPPQPS